MMKNIKLFLSRLIYNIVNRTATLSVYYQKSLLADCGENVSVGKHSDFIPSHIHIGNHVHIGEYASFIASIAHIYIKDHVMFGPHVTIRGGDHRTDVVGKYMIDIKESEKLPENDADVVIEEDCWIGCNVTVLKGVTIGRGSVVAAGSVVTRSCPPYSIIGGVPAKVLRPRFSVDEILEHEVKLYPEEYRLCKEQLLALGEK